MQEEDLQLNHNRDSANFVPPVGTTQTQLALMWGELLHLTDVSANDDFFEAGACCLYAESSYILLCCFCL